MKFTLSMFYDTFFQKGYELDDYTPGNDDEICSFRISRNVPKTHGILHISQFSENAILFQTCSGHFLLLHQDLEMAQDFIDETFQFYRNWEEKLLLAILKNENFQTLIDIAEEVFQNPIYIANWQGKVLGYTHDYQDAAFRPFWQEMIQTGLLPISCLKELRESENYNAVTLKNEAILLSFNNYHYRCILGIINSEQEILLHFQIVEYTARLTPTMVKLANVFLSLLENVKTDKYADYTLTTNNFFIDLLEEKEMSFNRLNWTLTSLGWEQKEMPFYCLFFKPNKALPSKFYLNGQLEQRIPGSKVIYWKDELLLLINQAEFEQQEHDIRYTASSLSLSCGISLPFSDWKELHNAYKQAQAALRYAAPGSVLSYCQQHIWEYTMGELARQTQALNLIHPALYKIKEYDSENDTELLKTLYFFLRNERNTTLTAKQLFIHRNTLQYRLHKINDLLNLDLDNPDNRLNLLASYTLLNSDF